MKLHIHTRLNQQSTLGFHWWVTVYYCGELFVLHWCMLNTVEEQELWHRIPNPHMVVGLSKEIWTVKLCCKKIVQFLSGGVGRPANADLVLYNSAKTCLKWPIMSQVGHYVCLTHLRCSTSLKCFASFNCCYCNSFLSTVGTWPSHYMSFFIAGSPTHSVVGQYCFVFGICHLSSSVTLHGAM